MPPRRELQARRRLQGFTQETIADAVGVAVTTYREWERGVTMPRAGFRPRLAKRLGVSLVEVDRLLENRGRPELADGLAVPEWLGTFASMEQGAARLWAFEPMIVHGLLQTGDYASTVIHAGQDVDPAHASQRLAARLARQGVLNRKPRPLDLSVILDESVLCRPAGGSEVMAGQLAHLVRVAAWPNVELRILPMAAAEFAPRGEASPC